MELESDFSEAFNFGVETEFGKSIARRTDPPILGDWFEAEAWAGIKPTQRLILGPVFRYQELGDPAGGKVFAGYTLRTRINYQFTREFFLRLVVQYNQFSDRLDLEPLVTYRINPFTAFFVGSRHRMDELPDPHGIELTERQYFAKFQYLFRI